MRRSSAPRLPIGDIPFTAMIVEVLSAVHQLLLGLREGHKCSELKARDYQGPGISAA
jgi:hypothetical protein